MANLQKVIKVTQAQYDVLASGGTVGGYTGLDDNYIYLIEDTNTYITSNGGTIDGGPLTFGPGFGIEFENNSGAIMASICNGDMGPEIIYNDPLYYKPLFANDTSYLIYSESDNYIDDFTFNTNCFRIYDGADTEHFIEFDPEDATITVGDRSGTVRLTIPQIGNGTFALTSDIPTVTLTTTAGSEAITVNSSTLNVVTRDTAQTITGSKTFKDSIKLSSTGGDATINFQNSYATDGYFRMSGAWFQMNKGLEVRNTDGIISRGPIKPYSTGSLDLGASDKLWRYTYTTALKDGNNANYSLLLPTMTSWTEDKTIATTDQLPQIKRYI